MVAVSFVLCLLTSAHAGWYGQDITKRVQELKTKEEIAANYLRFV